MILEEVAGYYEGTYFDCKGGVTSLENYINGKGDLMINFDCTADDFDLWNYMSQGETSALNEDQSSPQVEVFRFPDAIKMDMKYKVDKIRYGDIHFNSIIGSLSLADQSIKIQPTNLKTLGGDMSIQGRLSHKGKEELHYNFDLATKRSKFKSTFESVQMVKKVAPVFQYMFGEFNTQLSIDGDLDKTLAPKLSSVSAQGLLETVRARLENYELLDKLNTAFDKKLADKLVFPRTKNWFSIENGMVFLEKTPINIGSETFTIEGSHQVDGDMDYKLSGPISIDAIKNSEIGQNVWKELNENLQKIRFSGLPEQSKIQLDISLSGQADQPKIRILPLSYVDEQLKSVVNDMKDEKQKEVKDRIEKEKQNVDSLVENKSEEIKKDVKKEVKSLLDSGKTTNRIDSLREEAKKKTEKMKKKFKKWNPFGN